MLYHEQDFLIYDSDLGWRADQRSLNDLEEMGGPEYVALRCYPGTQMLIPTVSEISISDHLPIKPFYSIARQLEANPAVLTKHKAAIPMKDVLIMLEIARNLRSQTEGVQFTEDLSAYVKGDAAAAAAYESQRSKGGLILNVENRTLFQESNTDKLFLALPADSLITAYAVENIAPVPSMSDVCVPYPSMLYRHWYIEKILKSTPDNREKIIQAAVKTMIDLKFVNVPSADKLTQEFRSLPKEYVFGNPENNFLEIQDYEQDYYDALIQFIKHHINLFNRSVLRGSSEDEIKQQNEKDFSSCNLPKRLEAYLEELLSEIVMYHYAHTGRLTLSNKTFTDDDDGDGDGVKEEGIEVAFLSANNKNGGSNADICIKGYIQHSGESYGAGVWAEAIVKLCRWGSLKPASLVLGANNHNTIDLKEFNIRTSALNYSSLEKLADADGRTMGVAGISMITCTNDTGAFEFPAVLIITEEYQNPFDPDKTEVTYSNIAVQDIVRQYLSGAAPLSGVDLVNGFFECDEDTDDVPIIDALAAAESKSVTTPEFVNMCMRNNIQGAKSLSYALLGYSGVSIYMPKDDNFAGYISMDSSVSRTLRLYGCWLKAFFESAHEYEYSTLGDFLTWYKDNVYQSFEDKCASISGEGNNVAKLDASALFTDIRQVPQTAEPVHNNNNNDSPIFDEIFDEAEDEPMYPIYQGKITPQMLFAPLAKPRVVDRANPTAEPPIVTFGGILILPDKRHLFASLKDGIAFDPMKKPVPFTSAARLLFGAAMYAVTKGDVFTTACVASANTLRDMYTELIK